MTLSPFKLVQIRALKSHRGKPLTRWDLMHDDFRVGRVEQITVISRRPHPLKRNTTINGIGIRWIVSKPIAAKTRYKSRAEAIRALMHHYQSIMLAKKLVKDLMGVDL